MRRAGRLLLLFGFSAAGLVAAEACVSDPAGDGADSGTGADATTGDGGEGSDGSTAGDGSSVTDSGADAGVDSGPKCGFAGEDCCAPPLKDCASGTFCKTGKCMANDVLVIGDWIPVIFQIAKTSAHWNGSSWLTIPIGPADGGTNSYVASATGFAPTEYLAIAENDKVFRAAISGPHWSLCDPMFGDISCAKLTTTAQLSSIYGFGIDDYWISGVNTLLRCNGPTCTPTTTGLPGTFNGSFAGTSSTDLYLASSSKAYHFNGTSWSLVDGLTDANAIWARAPNDVWGGGNTGFQHWDGSSWSTELGVTRLDGGTFPGSIQTISGSTADDVWAGGQLAGTTDGFLVHWDGASWKEIPLPAGAQTVTSVYTASKIEAYASVVSGISTPAQILRWDGVSWAAMVQPTAPANVGWTLIVGTATARP